MRLIILLMGFVGLTLGACSESPYWQRIAAPSTAYLSGEQAQALLEKDKAQCKAETDKLRDMLDDDDDEAAAYTRASLGDVPVGDPRERDTCMHARGWDRVNPHYTSDKDD